MSNTINVKDGSGNPVTLDTQGTAITGEVLEAGGYSNLGWLASLRKALNALATALLARLPAALGGAGGIKAELVATITVPVSAASLPLPTGAATLAKQPALGTAGTASADVISVQGIASGTALAVAATALPLPTGAATEATLSGRLPAAFGTGGGVKVDIVSGGSGGGAVTNAGTFAVQESQLVADNLAFTDGTTKVHPAGFIFDEVAGTALTENDAAAARVNANRAQIAVIEDETTRGRRTTVTAANALKVDNSGVTQPISAASLPLPTGAATEATLSGRLPAAFGTGGGIKVDIVSGAGTGGIAVADKAAFTEGSTSHTPIGGVLNETISADPTEDQAAAARITPKRALHTNLRNQAGTELATSGAPLRVDPTGTTAQPITDNAGSLTVDNGGTFAVQDSQVVTDNAAFTDGTTKVQPAGFILDETAGTALSENDTGAARMDSKRAQVLVLEDATTRGQRATVSAANALKVDGSAVTQPVSAASLPLPTGATTEATLAGQALTDNAAFTDGTSKVKPAGFIFDEVAGTALTENDVAAGRVNANRAQVLVIEDDTTRGRRTTVTAANALKVDNSGVTQPISAASLPLPTGAALDATLTGGTLKAIARGAAKGSTAAADLTVTAIDANHNGADVNIVGGSLTATVAAIALTYTDQSGTIATNNTAQSLMALNASRKALLIQNPATETETLWIRFTGTAAINGSTSWPIEPGQTWAENGNGISTQAISVIAATAGHVYRAMQA